MTVLRRRAKKYIWAKTGRAPYIYVDVQCDSVQCGEDTRWDCYHFIRVEARSAKEARIIKSLQLGLAEALRRTCVAANIKRYDIVVEIKQVH